MNSEPPAELPMWFIGAIVFTCIVVVCCCIYVLTSTTTGSTNSSTTTGSTNSSTTTGESASSVATLNPGRSKDQTQTYQTDAEQQSIINQCLSKLRPGDNPGMCGSVQRVK